MDLPRLGCGSGRGRGSWFHPGYRLGHRALFGLRRHGPGGDLGFDPGRRTLHRHGLLGGPDDLLGPGHPLLAGRQLGQVGPGLRVLGLGELGQGVGPTALGTTALDVVIHVAADRTLQSPEDDALLAEWQIPSLIEAQVTIGIEPEPIIGVEPQTPIGSKAQYPVGIEIEDFYQTNSPYLAIVYGIV